MHVADDRYVHRRGEKKQPDIVAACSLSCSCFTWHVQILPGRKYSAVQQLHYVHNSIKSTAFCGRAGPSTTRFLIAVGVASHQWLQERVISSTTDGTRFFWHAITLICICNADRATEQNSRVTFGFSSIALWSASCVVFNLRQDIGFTPTGVPTKNWFR